MNPKRNLPLVILVVVSIVLLLSGCSQADRSPATEGTPAISQTNAERVETNPPERGLEMLALPVLAQVTRDGAPLNVVATTSIIGDVVAHVGGDAILLSTLMEPGQDPHSFSPGAQELTVVSEAQVIFVNGWDLEEALVQDLEIISEGVPIVPVSANIQPLPFAGHQEGELEDGQEHADNGIDPHTWLSVSNVEQWVENIKRVLSDLDPENAEIYENNAAAYLDELQSLETYAETQLDTIGPDKRFLITNHDSLGYFAQDYDFEVLGTVIPGASTLAEPSARDMADLIKVMRQYDVCSIFTETTVSDTLAKAVAAELDGCENVQVLKLYTGAIGPAGSGADSYIGMFRANVDTIVEGLK